jgi:methylenetetrahydrofolate reductase-like protein
VKVADLYARPGLTLSVEFFPPKTDKGEENLFSEIAAIKRLNPAFCSVTYGAGGSLREVKRGSIRVPSLHFLSLNKSYSPQASCKDLGL